jgi:tetratricopeptide (TPR) repeat protein
MRIFARAVIAALMMVTAVESSSAADPMAELSRADDALRRGQHEEAVERYTIAIESGRLPEDSLVAAYLHHAFAYRALGHHDKAMADYDALVSMTPSSSAGYNARGIAHKHRGEYEHALENFNEALRLNPNEPFILQNRAGAYLELKLFTQAIEDMDAAIELDPSIGVVLVLSGIGLRGSRGAGKGKGGLQTGPETLAGLPADQNESRQVRPRAVSRGRRVGRGFAELHAAILIEPAFRREQRRTSIVTSWPNAARNMSSRSRLKPRNRPRSILETSGLADAHQARGGRLRQLAVPQNVVDTVDDLRLQQMKLRIRPTDIR